MGILDDYEELDKQATIAEYEYYLKNISLCDIPELYQVWYDILIEKFANLPYYDKIIYLNVLKSTHPLVIHNNSYIWDRSLNTLNKNKEVLIEINSFGYYNGHDISATIYKNIQTYIDHYIIYGDTINQDDSDDIQEMIDKVLIYCMEDIACLLRCGGFRQTYCYTYTNQRDLIIEKTSKYSDIKYYIESLIDCKIKMEA